jgi:hypothetical protein
VKECLGLGPSPRPSRLSTHTKCKHTPNIPHTLCPVRRTSICTAYSVYHVAFPICFRPARTPCGPHASPSVRTRPLTDWPLRLLTRGRAVSAILCCFLLVFEDVATFCSFHVQRASTSALADSIPRNCRCTKYLYGVKWNFDVRNTASRQETLSAHGLIGRMLASEKEKKKLFTCRQESFQSMAGCLSPHRVFFFRWTVLNFVFFS